MAESARAQLAASAVEDLKNAHAGDERRVVLQWRAVETGDRTQATPIELRLRRIEVYAPGAKVLEATAHGYRELPRDERLHFIAEPEMGQRLSLSLDPGSGAAQGLLLRSGRMYALSGRTDTAGLTLDAADMDLPLADGSVPEASCSGDMGAVSDSLGKTSPVEPKALPTRDALASIGVSVPNPSPRPLHSFAPRVATRQVTLAIDTDNELLQKKFSNNTAAATAYVAELVAAMNAIYEDDPAQYGLQLRLLQGTLILRPSTTTDPYNNTDSSATGAALNEFGAWWRDNQGSVSRAFALKLSGKASNQNSSSGIAWLLTSGSYCAATGSSGSQVFGHYSVTRVFWNPSFNGARDAYVVAHELGHNLGARHTHCANASTGAQASTGTIDRCYNGESGSGCYGGTQACPSGAESPLAPQGTLMSYCHLNGLGCGVSTELHPTHVTQLNARLASQPSACLVPIGSNQAPSISVPASIAGSEDTPLPLRPVSLSDPDSANLTATFSVGTGGLNATSGAGVTVGGNASTRTLAGSPAALNAFLGNGSLVYQPVLNANGNVGLSIGVSDGSASASASVTLAIAAVNDAPTLAAPASLSAQAGVATAVTGVSYADPDAPTGNINVQATYGASIGSFTASSAAGVTVSGSGSNALTLSGQLAAVNAFVSATPVRYTASTAGPGTVSLNLGINDLGNIGGGALTASRTVNVTVSGVDAHIFANGFEP